MIQVDIQLFDEKGNIKLLLLRSYFINQIKKIHNANLK